MSCVTCEVTPPDGHTAALLAAGKTIPDIPGHVSARGTTRYYLGFLGLHVIWRGRNVTAQTVEAMPGDEHSGWVELLLLDDNGAPQLHAARYVCANPECEQDTGGHATWPPDGDDPEDAHCPTCYNSAPPRRLFEDHAVTVIRTGPVHVSHGTTIHTGAT
jgi:hypothetical protein